MKKYLSPFLFLTLILLSTSCGKWIAPPYTNVDKILRIAPGMELQEVNLILEIEPYDVYIRRDNNFIVVYNYRVKDRRMKLSGHTKSTSDEASQTAGTDWYGDSYYCYVYFQDNKVKSILTDAGLKSSEDILVKNNNIYLMGDYDEMWEE